jgi:glycosyltransferase involved in cell wall biosynthesis
MKSGPSAAELQGELLVLGLARNCAAALPVQVRKLAAALPSFRRVRWFVVESDSDDGTVATLDELTRSVPDFGFVSLGALRERLPARTERIAHCRNAGLEHLRSDPACVDVRWVAVADLDGVNGLLTPEAVAGCWQRDDWTVVTANQIGPYYDVWALRHELWSPGDCWAQARFLKAMGQDEQRATMACVYSRMVTIPPESPWIEVESAFGGFALYRAEALRPAGVRYDGVAADGGDVCEHVALHRALRAVGGRIFIDPALINADSRGFVEYWPERAQIERATRNTLFRALLRLFYGRQASKDLRRLLRSLS